MDRGAELTIVGPVDAMLLILLLLGGLSILIYVVRTGVPPMPTKPVMRNEMLALLPQRIDGVIYDLGSGWGGVAFALARKYPENKVIGIELSPLPWLWSCCRKLFQRRDNLTFYRRDLLKHNLRDAGAITLYLMHGVLDRVTAKFRKELPPGAIIISNTFALPDWTPDHTGIVKLDAGNRVFRYVV